MTYLFEMNNLTKSYSTPEPTNLFRNVSAVVERPERIALLGASGQGKSTLLRILSRLDVPDDGDIYWKGRSSTVVDPREWRMNVCYVSQQPYMMTGTIEDNLKTVSRLHKLPFDLELAKKLMAAVGLEHTPWNKHASDLSGGEKQRLALVRSLLLRPGILLLDEVTSSLDSHSKHLVEQLLLGWNKQEGTLLIWITHDFDQAQRFSSRVWYMSGGGLAADQAAGEFFNNSASSSTLSLDRNRDQDKEEQKCPT